MPFFTHIYILFSVSFRRPYYLSHKQQQQYLADNGIFINNKGEERCFDLEG